MRLTDRQTVELSSWLRLHSMQRGNNVLCIWHDKPTNRNGSLFTASSVSAYRTVYKQLLNKTKLFQCVLLCSTFLHGLIRWTLRTFNAFILLNGWIYLYDVLLD